MSKGFYCFGNAQVVRPNEVAEFIDDSVPVEEVSRESWITLLDSLEYLKVKLAKTN